jgi:hypothetical protein
MPMHRLEEAAAGIVRLDHVAQTACRGLVGDEFAAKSLPPRRRREGLLQRFSRRYFVMFRARVQTQLSQYATRAARMTVVRKLRASLS